MILKALAEFYQRLADDPKSEIAPPGFEFKAIDFLVVLNEHGSFENLRDIREEVGRNRKGRVSLVPKGGKRSANIEANLLWDNAAYVFGINRKTPDRGQKQLEAFVKKIKETFDGCADTGIQAVLGFLEERNFDPVFRNPVWHDVEESDGTISFVLAGESQLVCQRRGVVAAILEMVKPEKATQACSISGCQDVPAELHTAIKGVWGAQSSGGNIVSFNLDAFRSFGKKQGKNAPVGKQVEFAYTTALNHLLASEKQRMQVGDASTVFWAKDTCDLEEDFPDYLAPKQGEEAVSYEKIRCLLSAVKTGVKSEEANLPFFVLGLAPNASRISIRFWYEGDVKEIKERIAQHFADIQITRAPYDPDYLSLKRLLLATARRSSKHLYGDSDDIVPHLAGDVFAAILNGTPYPRTLLQRVVNRIKAEQSLCDSRGRSLQNVTFERAALIKGYLTRKARLSNRKKEVAMSLDRSYDNIGYVLGRKFAVLEKIQEAAHTPEGAKRPTINKTIRDTYFSAATSSPLVTFKRLDELAVHHLAKIRNSNRSTIWLEKWMQEVVDLISAAEGIPSVLKLEDQGRFAIGYYHQRSEFFSGNNTEDKGE